MPLGYPALLAENKRLKKENDRMRTALVEYYRAEELYERRSSPASYGLYREKSDRLVAIAKELAKEESKKLTTTKG